MAKQFFFLLNLLPKLVPYGNRVRIDMILCGRIIAKNYLWLSFTKNTVKIENNQGGTKTVESDHIDSIYRYDLELINMCRYLSYTGRKNQISCSGLEIRDILSKKRWCQFLWIIFLRYCWFKKIIKILFVTRVLMYSMDGIIRIPVIYKNYK